jgi:hypothetical protein
MMVITENVDTYLTHWNKLKLQSLSYTQRKAMKSKYSKIKKAILKEQSKKKRKKKAVIPDNTIIENEILESQ